jgi:hypothetical protein
MRISVQSTRTNGSSIAQVLDDGGRPALRSSLILV